MIPRREPVDDETDNADQLLPGSDLDDDAYTTLRQVKGILGTISQTLKSIAAKIPAEPDPPRQPDDP